MKDIFLSSALTACVLGVVIYLFRHWLLTVITQSIQHKYNKDLESLRHDLRQNEKGLELTHQAIIEHSPSFKERQFQALDSIWVEILRIGEFHPTLFLMLDILSEDEVRSYAHQENFKNPKINEMQVNESLMVNLDSHRPYVDSLPWALFFTYRQIFARIVTIYYLPSYHNNDIEWFDDRALQSVIAGVLLPEELSNFQGLKVGKIQYLRCTIQEKYLAAMKSQLSGYTASEDALREAKRIMTITSRIHPSK